MPFLPSDPWAIVGLAVTVAGTLALMATDWPKAYGLALLSLAVFGLEALAGFAPIALSLGFTTEGLLEGGMWWTPFTYMFVHAGIFHIFGNLFILLTAGPALEDRYGGARFMAIYFLAGFAAVVAHVVLDLGNVIGGGVAVGASGAIFGILTTFAVRHPQERLPILLLFVFWLPSFVVLLIHLVMNLAIMLAPNTGVAWYGHFAGYLVGLAAASVVKAPAAKAVGKLPDVDVLRPFARDRDMTEMLDKAAKFTGDDKNDAVFAMSWVDRFVARAECPHHHLPLERDGRDVRCPEGDVELRV